MTEIAVSRRSSAFSSFLATRGSFCFRSIAGQIRLRKKNVGKNPTNVQINLIEIGTRRAARAAGGAVSSSRVARLAIRGATDRQPHAFSSHARPGRSDQRVRMDAAGARTPAASDRGGRHRPLICYWCDRTVAAVASLFVNGHGWTGTCDDCLDLVEAGRAP